MSELDYTDAAAQEPEVEAHPLADLVDAALAKDYNKANEIFGQAVTIKLDDVMDQERIRLSNAIYNASEEEEDEEDEDDMDTDEDLDDSDMEDDDSEDDSDEDDMESDDEEDVEVEN